MFGQQAASLTQDFQNLAGLVFLSGLNCLYVAETIFHIFYPQVAAHLFQAGANIVKLGIQKTRGSSPDKYLGLY